MVRLTATVAVILLAALLPDRTIAAAAVDHADNAPYADGWQMSDNGGSGFQPWAFAFSGDSTSLAHAGPQFIDAPPALPENSLGAPAFALTTSDRASFFDTSEASRSLVSGLAINETFHLDVDGSALDPAAPAFTIGNAIQLFGSDGIERWAMFTNNGFQNDHWTATGNADTGIPAANAFHIAFTLTSPNTFDLVLTPIGGGTRLFFQAGATLTGTPDIALSRLRVSAYGTGSSADGSKEMFFNNVQIVPESGAAALCVVGAIGLLGVGVRGAGQRRRHCPGALAATASSSPSD